MEQGGEEFDRVVISASMAANIIKGLGHAISGNFRTDQMHIVIDVIKMWK